MEKIEIAGKEYPLIISAAAAKRYFSAQENEKDLGIDSAVTLIYHAVKDANMRMGFVRRHFSYFFTPSRRLIEHTVSVEDIQQTVAAIFPKPKNTKKGKA